MNTLETIKAYRNKTFKYFVIEDDTEIFSTLIESEIERDKNKYDINKLKVTQSYFDELEVLPFKNDIYYDIYNGVFIIEDYGTLYKVKGFNNLKDAAEFHYHKVMQYTIGEWKW